MRVLFTLSTIVNGLALCKLYLKSSESSNENNELVPTRVQTSWRVCIDCRKLNSMTRKDHFPIPFIDQMVERLTSHIDYSFFAVYFEYNQISIARED